MRTLHIALAFVTLSSTAAAFAETPYPVEKPFVSTLTRAQVKQDLVQAEHQGLLSQAEQYPAVTQASSADHHTGTERQMPVSQNNVDSAIYNGA